MEEYLDYYDIDGNFLGTGTRDQVHSEGLWHNTVHCRLYTDDGKVFFQIRKDTGTFYTTASGHVLAGEDIREAFHREVKEELGIGVDVSDAELVSIVPRTQDKIKSDGSEYHDRAKAHVYVNEYKGDFDDFDFDENEVAGVVLVDAQGALDLFKSGEGKILATIITDTGRAEREVDILEFLVTPNETHLQKYGEVLDKIISIT